MAQIIVERIEIWDKIPLEKIEALDLEELINLRNYLDDLIERRKAGKIPRRFYYGSSQPFVEVSFTVTTANEKEARLVRVDKLKFERDLSIKEGGQVVYEPIGGKTRRIECFTDKCEVSYQFTVPLKTVIAITLPKGGITDIYYYLVLEKGLELITSPAHVVHKFVKGLIDTLPTTPAKIEQKVREV